MAASYSHAEHRATDDAYVRVGVIARSAGVEVWGEFHHERGITKACTWEVPASALVQSF